MSITPPDEIGSSLRLLKQTGKDCNEKLLILQPHEHNRDREGNCVVYNDKYHQASCSIVIKDAGQRDAECRREKRGGAHKVGKERR